MEIKDLSSANSRIKFNVGPGSLKKQLNRMTRYGEFKNLRDNRTEIFDNLNKFKNQIKLRGGITRLQERQIRKNILTDSDKAGLVVTKGDKREIKKILEHFKRNKVEQPTQADTQKEKNLLANRRLINTDKGLIKPSSRISRINQNPNTLEENNL